jgi:hypothetical protein
MSQFKRFNASENRNWNDYDVYPAGTLTWDPDNGLRIHDGNSGGGNPVGGSFDGNYYSLNNRPNGDSAVSDLRGGSSSDDNGKYLRQYETGQSRWESISYNDLTNKPTILNITTVPNSLTANGIDGQMAFDDNYIYRCTTTSVAEVSYVYDAPHGRNTSPYNWQNQSSPATLRLFERPDAVAPQNGWTVNGVAITNVVTQVSAFGVIHDLTLASSIDVSTADSITVVQTPGVTGAWKKLPYDVPTDVADLTDISSLLPAAQVRMEMKSSSFTAVAGKKYWVDSTSGSLTITLPASPSVGDWVSFYDAEFKWGTYQPTVNGNGNNIRVVNFAGGPTAGWASPASTVTISNQGAYGPTGPLPYSFMWNGSVWSGFM